MDSMDKIVEMCRSAVADIIASVGGVGNLLIDENKMALVQAIANRLKQLGADVESILGTELANAYFQGMTDADSFLSTQGVDTSVNGVNKQVHLAGVQSIVADTMTDMSASFRTALIMGIADIDGILAQVNSDISKGMILGNPSDVTAKAVQASFAKSGMTSFVTKDGKRLPLDFYAQTVTRTKYRVAHTTGATNRYKESGVYHVKINEHHPTCGVCARYQGMVVALDPDHAEGFPVADQDVPLPPYHPNCQHVARPYVMDYHSETDIKNEKKKWDQYDPDTDPRTEAQKNLYKNEQDIRRKARQEMKEYEILKATAKPDDKVPKTLGAYRRLKRKGDDEWKALQATYKKNVGIVDGSPAPPGTPKKKKGTARGTKVGQPKKGTPKKTAPKKATPKLAPPKPAPPPVAPAPPPKPSGPPPPNLSPGVNLQMFDESAIQSFDQAIDGLELNDRRKASAHLLKSVKGWKGKVKIGKINANGHCGDISFTRNKISIGEFALRNPDHRPVQYQWKTMFHEFYHANLTGLKPPPNGFDRVWTAWEETATECSAFFMSDRAGIDISKITPSYSEYLVTNLPRLKQLGPFKDCETMKDFGAKFMKYRFEPKKANSEWGWLFRQVRDNTKDFNTDKYFRDHYLDHMAENLDEYTEMIFDSFQQDKSYGGDYIKQNIRANLWDGITNGKANREIKMALPIAMNRIGVKTP
jgi:hypothetical protein